MKKELQDKLYENYPKIFRQKDLSMIETCMCWGIECRDGWYVLIDSLCKLLQFNTDHNSHNDQYKNQIEAVQVKEKFGGLRFYTVTSTEAQQGAIDMAEYMSFNICEQCGTTKDVSQTKGGWIETLCEECKNKKGK